MTGSITVQEMKHKLLPLDHVRNVLATTEPLSTYGFTVGSQVRFDVGAGWEHGIDARPGTDPVDAYIVLGGGIGAAEFQLTKDALLEATSICGLTKTYAARCPAPLIVAQLNYWFREGLSVRRSTNRDFQLLVAAGYGAAITRQSVVPFSNLRLLEQAIDGIEARYGQGEVLADYKFTHSLRKTHLRLIVPAHERLMTGTGESDDTWSVGLQLKNSLIGEERTSLDAYLFRWLCTNGQIDARHTSGVWRRSGASTGRDAEVYEWARAAVDDILGGLEPALDAVQALTDVPVQGSVSAALRDVFEHYRVPLPERARIIDNVMSAGGDVTMYTLMNAITQVANNGQLEPTQIENLLRLGGDLPHAATQRCDESNPCGRLVH